MKRIALVLGLLFAAGAAVPADGAFPGDDGAFVYGYSWTGDFPSFSTGIAQLGEPHSAPHQLAACSDPQVCTVGDYRDPSVSPDGREVVFDAGRSLGVVGIDGSGFRLLPQRGADAGSPAFSPTGRQIAFATHAPGTGESVFISRIDGSHARRLVTDGASPAWSTHGWIAFVRRGAIYRIRPDGAHLKLLTRAGRGPSWSPHGTQLAFTRPTVRRGSRAIAGGLFAIDADGRHEHAIRRSASEPISDVAWSPSGRELVVRDDQSWYAIDLRGHRTLGLGETDVTSASGTFHLDGLDWQPLRRPARGAVRAAEKPSEGHGRPLIP